MLSGYMWPVATALAPEISNISIFPLLQKVLMGSTVWSALNILETRIQEFWWQGLKKKKSRRESTRMQQMSIWVNKRKAIQFLASRIQDFLVLDVDTGQTDTYSQPLEMSLNQGSVQISGWTKKVQ